jgi:hypothetical protein
MQVKMTRLFNAFIQTLIIYLKLLTAETECDSRVANNVTAEWLIMQLLHTGKVPNLTVVPQAAHLFKLLLSFLKEILRYYIKRGHNHHEQHDHHDHHDHHTSHPSKFTIHNHPTIQIMLCLDVMSYRRVPRFWWKSVASICRVQRLK